MQKETKSEGWLCNCIMYIKYFYEKGTDKLFFISKEDEARFMIIVLEESFKRAMKKKCLTLSF